MILLLKEYSKNLIKKYPKDTLCYLLSADIVFSLFLNFNLAMISIENAFNTNISFQNTFKTYHLLRKIK